MSRSTEFGRDLLQAARYQKNDKLQSILKQARGSLSIEQDESKQTALHWVVIHDQADMVDLLLTYHFEKNTPNKDHITPMVLAAQLGHWQCIEAFIKHSHANDTFGFGDVLLYAVKAGQFLIAKQLLLNGANSQARWTGTQFTPLHWAVENKDVAMIRLLLSHGCDQTLRDNSNSSALKRSVEKDDWQSVIALCSTLARASQEDLNEALIQAAMANQYRAVSALLEVGADPNARCSKDGRTALHWAVVHDSPELFALLLGHNATLASYDANHQTPVHLAFQLESIKVAAWFQALEVDVNIRDNGARRETINEIALRQGNKESFFTSIYQQISRPCAVVLAIVQNKQDTLIQWVEGGASLVNLLAFNNKTPLDYAIELGQLGLVTYISQQLQGDNSVERAFKEACQQADWPSAQAIDKERAMVMQLDAKYHHQLAWYLAYNTDVKTKLKQEAKVFVEKFPCDKARFYQLLSASKTARYRQFMFWQLEPTKTSAWCQQHVNTLEAHRNIGQNVEL